jgi:hypothetical protein
MMAASPLAGCNCRLCGVIVQFRKKQTMCLGIPGKIIELYDQNGFLMEKWISGFLRECCFVGLPNAQWDNMQSIHAGLH